MAADEHPLDPEVRQRVAELLYGLLPALYRVRDEPPKGKGDLRRFLSILAAPLAEVRQSVESLQADLFIDSASDALLPYLAEMVGTTLEFPDAATNRRDVRGTASWRRRKGTPLTLESLGTELFEQLVVPQEGWKRLLLTQDLNLLRPERTVPDVRDALLAEASSGPRDTLFHAAGHLHFPRHVEHWLHPTQLFTVRHGSAAQVSIAATKLDYSFHPLGKQAALRVRRGEVGEPSQTDRLPPVHLAREPERYFGEDKSFLVRVCGLPAAVVGEPAPFRQPSSRSADVALVEGMAVVTLLESAERGWMGPVLMELYAVPLEATATPGAWRPKLDARSFRGSLTISQKGVVHARKGFSAVTGPHVAMLRLAPPPPERVAFFPGATLELSSESPRALLASGDPTLAAEGFLRGALIVQLPATWIEGEVWLHVAADGSVREALRDGQLLPVRESGAFHLLEGEALVTGPGAAWPPGEPRASDELLNEVPPSASRGPVVMHGGKPMLSNGDALPPGARVALSFALQYPTPNGFGYQPVLRLELPGVLVWGETERWAAVDTQGKAVSSSVRFPELARFSEALPEDARLVVRLEGARVGVVLPPCEVAWTRADGEAVLLHLPTLSTLHATPDALWPTTMAAVGPCVALAVDGSSRWPDSGQVARYALGASPVAPIRQHATLRRRRLRTSHPELVGMAGYLNVAPLQGLFSFLVAEQPQNYPPMQFLAPQQTGAPPSVTVDYQEGYSGHVGARAAPREPLLGVRQPAPTRVVSARGRRSERTPSDVPLYPNLGEALKAISASAAPAAHEVIQLEDSSTYQESLTWPGNISRLTVQAAEGERPVISIAYQLTSKPAARYERLTLRGLTLTWRELLFLSGRSLTLPEVEAVDLQFCTLLDSNKPLVFQAPAGRSVTVDVSRCVTEGLELRGAGQLTVKDSVVDAGTGAALSAAEGTCELSRVTVLGSTQVLVLEASEVIFDGEVRVTDRFHGCVRYSRVPEGAVLPRRHRVVEGTEVRFVSRDRFDPAHARLAEDCDPALTRGAEDGSELGAFHLVRLGQRLEALTRRLTEFTPAGLSTGVTRLD